MKNKKLIQSLESFIVLPLLTMSVPIGSLPKDIIVSAAPQIVLSQKQNIEANGLLAFNQTEDQEAKILRAQADAIDAYFKGRSSSLEGLGMKMAQEALKNDLDYRLLPAIATRESNAGEQSCKHVDHNFFGWGSCKIGFKSDEEAIEVVAINLGGNNPDTASHYSGQTTKEILKEYNPPSIVPNYSEQVIKIMDSIGDLNLGETNA